MSVDRSAWAEFIASRAERYLFLRPASRFEVASLADNAALDAFLRRMVGGIDDARLIAQTVYLCLPNVSEFFDDILRELLRAIARGSHGIVSPTRRGIRGKVMWPQTLRMRDQKGGDPALFVTKRSEPSTNLPENQLLRLYLDQVVRVVRATSRAMGTGTLPAQIVRLSRQAELAVREPHLRTVSSFRSATTLMKQRARRHRNWRYGRLLSLNDALEDALSGDRWENVLSLINSGYLDPIADDDLFELYVLVVVLDLIAVDLEFGPPIKYGLIRKGRRETASFVRQKDGTKLNVYFDLSPAVVHSASSKYRTVIKNYRGIRGSEHRPDLVLEFEREGQEPKYVYLEMKGTVDPSYSNESVYKMFSYLYDFADTWATTAQGQSPKAIVVFPYEIKVEDGIPEPELDLAIAFSEDRSRIAKLLTRAISDWI